MKNNQFSNLAGALGLAVSPLDGQQCYLVLSEWYF